MVETRTGLELARVTLCQLKTFNTADGRIETELVFDALVRPTNTVLDYKTEFSGMTAEILNDNTKDICVLEQVQAALLATIRWNDIVIGHSLENDLRATRWIHETVIDTSVLFRPNKSFKYSLRHLAAVLLKLRIQRRDKPHCSEEDAVTALKLAVGRVVKGSSFGINEKPSSTNILAELSSARNKATIACMGASDWLQRHILSSRPNAIHALQCDSVCDYNAKAISSWMAVNAVWANFRLKGQGDMDQLENLLKDVTRNLQPRAVLMVAIQSGYEKADRLTKTRAVRRNPKATIPWSDMEEEAWCQAVEECRQGCVFWITGQRPPE
jgi:RNA exonuclease 1